MVGTGRPEKRPGRGPRRRAMTKKVRLRRLRSVGGVGLNQATIQSQTTPARARFWLKRIDRRIAYANSVVDE